MSDRAPEPQAPLDLETFATVSVELERAGVSRAEVLAKRAVPASSWERAQLFWSRRLADDAIEDGPLVAAFAAAIERARGALGPLPPMSPEEWAALTLEVAQRGAGPALAAKSLLPADYFRLAQHWAKTLATDAGLAARYNKALYASSPRK